MTPELMREIERVFPPAVRAAALARLRVAARPTAEAEAGPDYTRYASDPVGFARDVLRVTLTPDQSRWMPLLCEPPGRVMVKSGHNLGKTFGAAVASVWWFYSRPKSVVITTAPTQRDIVDLLWSEIRLLVQRAGLPPFFSGPAAPEMWESEEHWAKGYTASKGESFQGRHRERMLFVFDEAEGVDAPYWRTTNTMFKPGDGHGWLAILNPTTTTSQSYQEERATDVDGDRKWAVVTLSSLDHPNIAAGLENRRRMAAGLPAEPLPVPNAVGLEQAEGWLGEWFEPVAADEADPESDIEFPPGSGQWHRPGPEGEGRVLGRRPSAGTFGVWSERLWQMATGRGEGRPWPQLVWDAAVVLPELGCDVARFGDDRTEICTRWGPCAVEHEDHGGWDTVRVADRLMGAAGAWAAKATAARQRGMAPVDPKKLAIKVDDTGVGGGVTDILRANGYRAVPVNAGEAAPTADKYPRVRDELWFTVAGLAKAGRLDLSRLGAKRLAKMEPQALAPTWKPTADRRRQVEAKEDTKKRIGRSPDGMDALNLAFWETGGVGGVTFLDTGKAARPARGPFGR